MAQLSYVALAQLAASATFQAQLAVATGVAATNALVQKVSASQVAWATAVLVGNDASVTRRLTWLCMTDPTISTGTYTDADVQRVVNANLPT